MIALILKFLGDNLLKAVFGFISQELEKRNLIAQGKSQQHIADLEASQKEAVDANKIKEHVAAESSADVDADLDKLRRAAASSK